MDSLNNSTVTNKIKRAENIKLNTFDDKKLQHYISYGANYLDNNIVKFKVDAPKAVKMWVEIAYKDTTRPLMQEDETKLLNDLRQNFHEYKNGESLETVIFQLDGKNGEFETIVHAVKPGLKYRYIFINNKGKLLTRNDPRSSSLPFDVHGWSATVDHNAFEWGEKEKGWINGSDARRLKHLEDREYYGAPPEMIIDEVNIAVLAGYKNTKKRIDKIAELGVNAIEIMPVGEFAGRFNWGYDGINSFCPENSYGTPEDLKDLIRYAHEKGISVIMDVVPNHIGPIGAVQDDYGPCFDNKKSSPWGKAINFEGPGNQYMKKYMIDMSFNWLVNYHCDGLRFDMTKFMESDITMKLISSVIRSHERTKDTILIAEDGRNSKRICSPLLYNEVINPIETAQKAKEDPAILYNLGYSAQWGFDFQHTLEALVTKKSIMGLGPSLEDLESEFYTGVRRHDHHNWERTLDDIPEPPPNTHIVYHTSHDEIGNRGATRLLLKILCTKLKLNKRIHGGQKETSKVIFELIKGRNAGKDIWNYTFQKNIGIKKQISKIEFEHAYKSAQALYRVATGAVFAYPGPKMFMMGDLEGELSPFKFFAEYPLKNGKNDIHIANKVSKEKGYDVGEPALIDSVLYQKKYTDSELKEHIQCYCYNLIKIYKENRGLTNVKKMKTHIYKENDIMHVHKWNNFNVVVAVMNFSNKDYKKFKLNDIPKGKWEELINSNNHKYGGNGHLQNDHCYTDSDYKLNIKLPKESFIIFKKVG